MTCEQMSKVRERPPWECSIAELAAAVVHLDECVVCSAAIQRIIAKGEKRMSAAERTRFEGIADELTDSITARVMADPEAAQVILEGCPGLENDDEEEDR